MINLKAWDERKESTAAIINQLKAKTRHITDHITDAQLQFFTPPTVPGFGNAGGFDLRVLDRTGRGDLQATNQVMQRFVAALNQTPAIEGTFSGFNPNFPQYLIHLDADLTAKKGVTTAVAMRTLQTLMGSNYASNFIRFGQMYKVMVQALPGFRTQPENVLKLYVKNDRGEMVPFATFLRLERVYGPEQLTRYNNMHTSATLNGDAAPGFSSGDAVQTIQQMAAKELPRGYTYEWSGMTPL